MEVHQNGFTKETGFTGSITKICELIRHSEPEVEYLWLSDGSDWEVHHEETGKTG